MELVARGKVEERFFFFFFLVGRKRDEVVTCTGETMKGEGNGTRQPGRRESDEWMT